MKEKNRLFKACCSIFATISLLCLAQVSHADGTDFKPDHYLSYDIRTTPHYGETVLLKDQFINWTQFFVFKPFKLLNPTKKRHNNHIDEINNPDLHYTAFKLKPNDEVHINAKVRVTNQFGAFEINKFKPDHLLVPSYKIDFLPLEDERDPVYNAEHYLCYDIPKQEIPLQFGYLIDQFRGREFVTTKATKICNPVAKIHDGKLFDIVNDTPENHLMCFEMTKRRISKTIALLNQFGILKSVVLQDDELCVPSTKIEIPQFCQDFKPDEEGICGGSCEDPNFECRTTSDGLNCGCFPPQVDYCEDSLPSNDGFCGGVCLNPDYSCQMSADGQSCACLPPPAELCGDTAPDANGVCGGLCENPGDNCEAVDDGTRCACLPPPAELCGDTAPDANGVCGGLCENPDNNCEAVDDGTRCACLPPPVELCGDTGPGENGVCGGLCENPNDKCETVDDGTRCACLPPPVELCGDTGPGENGVCGGLCENPGDSCEASADGIDCTCISPL